MTTDLGISFRGTQLSRPESVLSTKSGDIFCSHKGHGVMRICPDGRQFLLQEPSSFGGMPVVPNGIALRPVGSFLIANISDAGGVLELDTDGLRPHAVSAGSSPLPPVNFVYVDQLGKIWVTVSSILRPRSRAYRRDVKNGYVGSHCWQSRSSSLRQTCSTEAAQRHGFSILPMSWSGLVVGGWGT